jgi:hypothetical protein
MMKKQEIKKFSFDIKIVDIILKRFSIEDVKSDLNSKLFVFEFTINFNIDPNTKLITLDLLTKVFADKSKETFLAKMESQGIFEVINLDKIIEEHNGVPNMILVNFAGVMVSTTRGFMILESKGTIINGAVMPFVDPNSFFKP